MTPTEPTFDRSALLDELRADCSVEGARLERVRERVATTLTTAHLAAIGPQPSLPRRLLRASWTGVAAALAVGTALGAGGHAAVSVYFAPQRAHAPPPAARTNEPPPKRVAPAPTIAAAPVEPEAEAPKPAAPAEPAARPLAAKPSAEPAGIDAELEQLDRARSSLARGDAGRALALLSSHATRHHGSMLAQERDALTVKALVSAGRHAEARAVGERFIANYPNGLLLDAVKSSLATIP
jgi:hypothetical protein